MNRTSSSSLPRLEMLQGLREGRLDYHSWLNTVLEGAIRDALTSGEEHDNGSSLVAAVEAGRGVAIVPSVFSSVAGQRIVFRELRPNPEPLVVGLAHHRRHLGPVARQFVKAVSGLAT